MYVLHWILQVNKVLFACIASSHFVFCLKLMGAKTNSPKDQMYQICPKILQML